MEDKKRRMVVFTGSYSEASDEGIHMFSFDEASGTFELLDSVKGLKNPTFLNVDAKNMRLYAIGEVTTDEGQRQGEAVSYIVDLQKDSLKEINRVHTVSAPTCHIQRDKNSQHLIVVSYHGGMVGLLSLNQDGRIGELLDVKQHEGSSVHERQDRPHPHSAFFSPDERFVFVSDLGLDRIRTYKIENNKLLFHGETVLHPGAGPRHLTFHPNGNFAYVINELDSTITSFQYHAQEGQLLPMETLSTLPANYEGENTCAEIAMSKDGRFLYGSNRGHDSIVLYAVDSVSGKLTYIEHVSSEGQHPRHFALTPSGKHLIAVNRDTNNMVTFEVNQETGRLHFSGTSVTISKPVCVKPVYL